jgi:hypothetical protein
VSDVVVQDCQWEAYCSHYPDMWEEGAGLGQLIVLYVCLSDWFQQGAEKEGTSKYSRGYKKRAIAEKMFGTLVIFSESLQGYFSTFFLFFVIRGQLICIWKVFLGHSSQRGHQRRPQS